MSPVQDGGEAMVAIIQGLRDAGLAVTLMNAPRGYFSQKPARSRRPSFSRADVQTNTEWPRRTHSAQICDSHYATSYQLAHCRLSPTSPSPELPEFPIQRGAPSRSRGNFRVGQSDTGSIRPRHTRSRGTFSSGSVAPCDRFADSLRKYPLCNSAELLQRLLATTQAKYLSKNPSRSMRSFHSPRTSHNKCNKGTNKASNKANKETNKCGSANKDIQTYTRIVNEVVEMKEKVRGKRNKKNVSVETAFSAAHLDQHSKTPAALPRGRAASRTYAGGSEVRYLSDVSRVIRDTIRQMVDTNTVPCSNAACRYKEHKRHHHRSDGSTNPLENESEENANDDQINENYDYLKAGACHRSSCTEPRQSTDSSGQCSELCIEEVKKFIRKTIKQMVDCNPTCSKKLSICKDKRLQFLNDSVSTPTQIQEEEEEEELSENNNSVTKVDAQTSDVDVCSGLKSAVCPNYMHRYRQHRKLYHDEEIGDDDEREDTKAPDFCFPPPKTKPSFFSLRKPCVCDDDKKRDSLDDVMLYMDDDDYMSEAMDVDIEQEVMAWITQLPVYTDNTEENKATILEMAQDLIEKLTALRYRPDYDERALEEITAFLAQLPYAVGEDKSKDKTPDQEDADEDQAELDELREILSRWHDCLNLELEKRKSDLIEEFVHNLMPMIEKNNAPKDFKSKILKLVQNAAPSKAVGTQKHELNDHVDDLVSELHYLALRRHARKNKRIRKKFLDPIYEWLMESDVPKPAKEKHRLSASQTDSKLRHMVTHGANDESMHGEIKGFFKSMPNDALNLTDKQKIRLSDLFIKKIKYGLSPMSSNEKLVVANDLLKNILPKIKKIRGKTIQSKQPVLEWLENNPYIEEEDKENNRNIAMQFDKKLQQMRSENIGDEEMENEINDFLDTLSTKGIPITPDQKSALAKQIRDEMKSSPIAQKPTYNKAQPMSNWLKNASNISKQIKEKNKKVVQGYDDKLQEMKSQDVEDDVIEEEIKDYLDTLSAKGVSVPPKQKNDIARNILKELKSTASQTSKSSPSDWLKNVPNIPKPVKEKNKNLFDNFGRKIQQMQADNVDEDVIKDEINAFMDSLPAKGIKVTSSEKAAMTKNMLQEQVTASDKQPTSEWFNNAQNIPEAVKQKNKVLVENFDKKLQELKSQNIPDDVIEDEISEFMDTLSKKCVPLSLKQKREMTEKLLKESKSAPTKSQTRKFSASSWLGNSPNIPKQVKDRNKKAFDNFEKKIQQLKANNVDEDIIQDEINEFVNSLPAKGIKITPSEKETLATKLLGEEVRPGKIGSKPPTTEWFDSVKNIPEAVKQKNKSLVENFDKKLQAMKAQNIPDDVIEDEINDFMDMLSIKGVPFSSKQKSDIAKNLIKETKSMPTNSQTRKPSVPAWLENAPNIPQQVKDKNKKTFENFEKKLQQMQAENVNDDVIQDEINEFVNSLPSKGIKITPQEKETLTKKMLGEEVRPGKVGPEQPTMEWFENAKNIPEEVKQKNKKLVQNFDNKIQEMKSRNIPDDVIEDEINEFMDTLAKKGVPLSKTHKSDITKKKLKDSSSSNAKTQTRKESTSEWLEKATNVPEQVKQKNKNLVKDFDTKIQQMRANNIDEETIQDEINEFVDSLPRKGINLTPKQKNELSQTLQTPVYESNKVRKGPTMDFGTSTPKQVREQKTQPLSDWLENSPNVSKQTKDKNRNLINNFDKKIEQMKADNVYDDVIQNEINKFVNSLPEKGIKLSPKEKQSLKKSLKDSQASDWSDSSQNRDGSKPRTKAQYEDEFDDPITRAPNLFKNEPETSQVGYSSTSDRCEITGTLKTLRPASEWLETSADIPKEAKLKNKGFVKKFDQELNKLKSDNASDHVIENQIRNFLGDLPDKGISVTPKEKDRLRKSLLDVTDESPSTGRPIANWLDSSMKIPSRVKSKTHDMVDKFDDKLKRLRAGNATEGEIEDEIGDFLDVLKQQGIGMSPQEKAQLVKKFLAESKMMLGTLSSTEIGPTKRKRWSQSSDSKRLTPQMKRTINNEVSNILDKYDIPPEYRDEVEKSMADALADALLHGTSDKELENTLMDILRNAGVSEAEAKRIVADMMKKKKQMAKDFKIPALSPDMKKAINNEVGNILDKYDIPPEYRDEVEKSMADALADALLHGTSDKELENTLMDILRNAGVSEAEAKRIVADMMKKKKQMANDFKIPTLSPDMKKAINNEVGNILDKYDIPPEYRDEVEKSMADALADALLHGTSDKELENTLMDILRKAGVSEAKRIVADMMKKKKQMAKHNNIPDSKTLGLSASQSALLQNNVEKSVSKWLDDTNTLSRVDKNKLRDDVPKLAEDINQNMQSNESANLFDAVKDALTPWVRSVNKSVGDDKLSKMAKEIESALNKQGITESSFKGPGREVSQDQINSLLRAPEKFIKNAVDKWTKTLTLPAANKSAIDVAKQNLAGTLKDAFVSNDGRIPPSQEDEIFQGAVGQFLDEVPGHSYTADDEKPLADSLKGVFKDSAKNYGHPRKSASKKGADVLLDDIAKWAESIPIESNTPEEKENADKMKQDIKGKLIHKIGELNMNPEIFNDDFLYEDMLEDEVDRMLLNTGSDNVKKQLSKLKKSLIDIVRKARQKIRDENAGQVYRQQLKDAVNRTLPPFQFTSPEERASFELLKEDIADDFINMHYVGGDPNEINRLKNKIDSDIYDFCMKYLRRCPASPLDTRQINQTLYPALESIPEPQNDSFRYEIELVKIKDVINNWIKDLPLGYQSGLKKLQASKMKSILAKKLLDMENDEVEDDEEMNKEIVRFLNKLPLNISAEEELVEFANDLIQRLKNTQELRKMNAAHRHCIDACFLPCTPSYTPPPCTLSQEDLEHLERIKQRNRLRRKISFKDACLSPCSIDTSTQTELRNLTDICPGVKTSLGRKSSSVQTHCRRMQAVGSQVCPNVTVNAHNWESQETDMPTETITSPCEPMPRPCAQRSQSPKHRPDFTSRHSQIQQCNRPSYCQTSPPNVSNYQGQCELPQYQEPPPMPSRAQLPSRPTQYTEEPPRIIQQRVPQSAQNISQQRSRDDSYLSEPSQGAVQNRPATAQTPRNVCKPVQKCMRESGFTICDPCPEAAMPPRRPCQVNQGNQRGAPPCMTSSRQGPGPSYQTQSSDLYSSSQDQQPCYSQQPCFMSSTPISSEDFDPNRFQNRVTRVTHLGSFDNNSRRIPNFPKFNQNTLEYEFWDTEYRSNPSGNEDGCRKRCRCKPKCGKYKGKRKPCYLANDEAMSSCAKCCGVHCPFPSYMFFR